MIKPIPNEVIDSWDDLYVHNELKILVHRSSSIIQFANIDNSPMALKFKTRIKPYIIDYSEGTKVEFYNKIISGKYAYIRDRYNLLYSLLWAFNNSKELLNTFHISSEGGGQLPIILPINGNLDKNIIKSLNKL